MITPIDFSRLQTALEMVGFDLTLLTVFGGALAVGVGLGLQKLAANYIAGFTILLDKSVRLGDLVTVDGRTGIVSQVTARYVVVRSLDGVEAIVPNETMVTTTVLNHGYTTPGIRVAINVQVSHGSDVERALALLVEIAGRQSATRRTGSSTSRARSTARSWWSSGPIASASRSRSARCASAAARRARRLRELLPQVRPRQVRVRRNPLRQFDLRHSPPAPRRVQSRPRVGSAGLSSRPKHHSSENQ